MLNIYGLLKIVHQTRQDGLHEARCMSHLITFAMYISCNEHTVKERFC